MISENKRNTIGNILVIAALFLVTNIEWNYFNVYLHFAPYDIFALIIVLALASLCYFRKEDLKSKPLIISFGLALIVSVLGMVVTHSKQVAFYLVIVFLVAYLASKIKFGKWQSILISCWMGLFFFYWTFDVKGYFKGYDVYYGSIILFTGFIFTFVVIEYLKFCVKSYTGDNRFLKFLSKHDYLIGCFQIVLIIWAFFIMKWYQSLRAFVFSMIFVLLMIIPKDIMKLWKNHRYNYFEKLSLCGIVAFLFMFVFSTDHLELISMPFVLSVVSLLGIARGFYSSGVSDDYCVFDSESYRKSVKSEWKSRALVSGIAILTVLMSVSILSPLENYYPNIKDFYFAISDYYPVFLFGSFVILLLAIIAGVILRKDAFKLFCTFLFSLGVTTYIQVMFLNKKLSETNGSKLDIDSLGSYPTVNIIVWFAILIGIIVLLYFAGDSFRKIILYVGGGLCIIQLVAVVSLPFSYITRDRSLSYELSATDEFELGSKDNIVVFVLDTLGNVQYEEAVAEYPEIKDYFPDFIYYNNADCSYGWTMPSMTHILTLSDVDFEADSLYDWQYESWNSDKVQSMYDKLHENGYQTKLYTVDLAYTFGDGENLVGKFDNVKRYPHVVDRSKVRWQMFRFSMLKVLPYKFKTRFLVTTDDFQGTVTAAHDDSDRISDCSTLKFYEWLSEGLTVSDSVEKEFKIIHLDGTHATSRCLDENLNVAEKPNRNQRIVANLKLVKLYLAEMERLGKYDDATVIITADHGTHLGVIDPQPILFVKNKGEKREKTAVSTAPVSHSDLMPTILKTIGADYSEYGLAYSDIPEDEIRERTCGYISEDQDIFSFYTYSGNREELLKKFPANPDRVEETLK